MGEEPCETDLSSSGVVLLAERGEPVTELEDVREVLGGVAGGATPIVRRQVAASGLLLNLYKVSCEWFYIGM